MGKKLQYELKAYLKSESDGLTPYDVAQIIFIVHRLFPVNRHGYESMERSLAYAGEAKRGTLQYSELAERYNLSHATSGGKILFNKEKDMGSWLTIGKGDLTFIKRNTTEVRDKELIAPLVVRNAG